MDKYHLVWHDYELSPMAANLQMVFYRNDSDDVLVKFPLNEEEVMMPISSDTAPYYSWHAAREYLLNRIDSPNILD